MREPQTAAYAAARSLRRALKARRLDCCATSGSLLTSSQRLIHGCSRIYSAVMRLEGSTVSSRAIRSLHSAETLPKSDG